MMPLLFVLLVVLVISSLMLPRALEGVKFLLNPDFSQVTKETFLDALGQTFFSLSTGMAALVTYSSYFGKQVNLIKSAWQIATIDTIVAILASLMIFPAAFSVGIQPDSGPSLIFITLPNVFQQAFATAPIVGYIISILFYLLLSLAALTSLISMHETPTAFVSEEFHLERKTGAIVVTVLALITSALCSLSIGAVPSLKVLGRSLFDFFDFLSANVLLTTGGFLTAIYVGWVLEHRIVRNQVTNWGTTNNKYFHLFVLSAKYICPTGIALIFMHQFGLI
jgi:NSS family neurotransmitter:Na+ symporter